MTEIRNAEDRKIRLILIGAASGAVIVFLTIALLITIMIANNFNILEWME